MLRTIVVLSLFVCACLGRLPAAAAAGDDNPNHAAYLKYCGSCHGPEGKGDGVLAPLLTPKPTDLTQIAKKKGGEFDALAVFEVVAGPRMVKAHGTPQMPVWGEELRQERGGEDPRGSQITLATIINYLRSIQAK